MDDALLVGHFQRFRNLVRDRQRFVNRKRASRNAFSERLAVDQFEDEEQPAVRFVEAVDRTDVRMIERREELRFALEPGEAFGIPRDDIWQDLERHVAIELCIARAIDLAHAARAQSGDDFVRAEARASGQGHAALILLWKPQR